MMTLREYASHDAIGLMELVQRGEVSTAEITRCALDAIEKLNPLLNFMSGPAAPAEFVAGRAFSGLPLLVKEGCGARGQPTVLGSRLGAGLTAAQDSEYMKRLRAVGIAAIGATTAPEFGAYCVTESLLHGATRNPWNLDHSPGGSSGGSSAAVIAGVVPVATSSDGGGSIRGPAHCTGTFGLKPSRGRNPNGSSTDGGPFGLHHFHVTTRSVRDSAAFLDALQGPVPGSRYWVKPPERAFLSEVGAPPGKLRIAVTRDSPMSTPLHPDCREAIDQATRLCEDLGHIVEEASPPIDWLPLMETLMMAWPMPLPRGIALIEQATNRIAGPGTLEPMTLRMRDFANGLTAGDVFQADAIIQAAKWAVDDFLARFDAWIMPTGVSPAPLIGQFDPSRSDEDVASYLRRALSDFAFFTPLLNFTGHPAASVPLHQGRSGLPVGVQVVTSMGDEATLLRLASQWEAARPWQGRRPPISL
ncbi:amidase [Solimonas sp. SE-A11]|uniref:amidase n=1 Tax=Solimonas sp. SE-A11 TaxID=3054954 RepID=UPI00259CB80B|nr:amidase family protein [Solimonas sp. SE-A11]MDM4768774.1 amidase family protein [Solimonas sp. SE-A11]